jgi:hypothetical protein
MLSIKLQQMRMSGGEGGYKVSRLHLTHTPPARSHPSPNIQTLYHSSKSSKKIQVIAYSKKAHALRPSLVNIVMSNMKGQTFRYNFGTKSKNFGIVPEFVLLKTGCFDLLPDSSHINCCLRSRWPIGPPLTAVTSL